MATPEETRQVELAGNAQCPFCEGHNVEGRSFEGEGSQAWQRVICPECGAIWNEIYTMTSVERLV